MDLRHRHSRFLFQILVYCEESKSRIDFLNKYINEKIIDKHMKILKLKEEIEKENEIKNKLEKKSKKIDDIINKGKKILIKDLPYFEKLSEYSNKKLKIAKLSSLDLINSSFCLFLNISICFFIFC